MEDNLKIGIGADVSGLEKGLAQAQTSLTKFGRSAQAATPALSNLARVAQDAPFGFIGIANNLDPLLNSFQQLKQQSGGVGGALKSLAAGLAGPAGLAVGLSVVTSGIIALTQKYGSLSAAIEALANSNNKQFQQFQELRKIQQEAAEDAGKEVARLDLLNSIITDNSAKLDLRKRAIKELRAEYGQYLQNVTDEQLLNDKAAVAIERATQAILNKSLALAAQNKLAEIGAKLLDNQLSLVDAVNRYETATNNARKANERAAAKGVQGLAAVNTEAVAYQTELEKTRGRLQDLGAENASLEEQYKRILALGNKFAQRAGLGFFKPERVRTGGAAEDEGIPGFGRLATLESDADALFKSFRDLLKRQVSEGTLSGFEEALKLVPKRLNANTQLFAAEIKAFKDREQRIKEFQEAQQKALLERNRRNFEQLKAQQAEFTQILGQGLAQPLGDLIFNFLDKGKVGFKEFADAAINAIKRIVAQLVATKIIQLLASLTPFGQAQRLGSGLGNLLGSGFGFIGRSAAPSFGGGGLSGGVNLTGQVVFVQRGSDLVGVLSRSNNRINRVG